MRPVNCRGIHQLILTKGKEENEHTVLSADMSAIQVIPGRRNAQPVPPGNLRFNDFNCLIT